VYFAADGLHLGLNREGTMVLVAQAAEYGMCPAVSYLFRTAAEFLGRRAIGVLLTGMGRDGALELKALRDAGADTFAQDEATCAVFGMPGEAVRLGAASRVMPVEAIADEVVRLGMGEGGSWRR
jgi:two-component system chemotaxis response regulator CheB